MAASPLSFLRAGPPPPKVVLLPDGLFFSRAIPITPGATSDNVATQVELALESVSPFPLAQLYYGWFWLPGAQHALAYATYRRRFTSDQTATWGEAELVIPASAALLGAEVQPATTVLLPSSDGITAVHWEAPPVASRVLFRMVPPEAAEPDRSGIRGEMLRELGGSKQVIDVPGTPVADAAHSDHEITFRTGDFVSKLPAVTASALDVRDKGELAALRAARKRDVLLWRVTIGCAAALVLLALGEAGLVAGSAWQRVRIEKIDAQSGRVQQIHDASDLNESIQNLITRRLLPLEMLTSVLGTNAEKKPGDIVVTHVQAGGAASKGIYTLTLELQTTNPAEVPVFRDTLQKLPECRSATLDPMGTRGALSLFRLTVTFKPGSLKPESA